MHAHPFFKRTADKVYLPVDILAPDTFAGIILSRYDKKSSIVIDLSASKLDMNSFLEELQKQNHPSSPARFTFLNQTTYEANKDFITSEPHGWIYFIIGPIQLKNLASSGEAVIKVKTNLSSEGTTRHLLYAISKGETQIPFLEVAEKRTDFSPIKRSLATSIEDVSPEAKTVPTMSPAPAAYSRIAPEFTDAGVVAGTVTPTAINPYDPPISIASASVRRPAPGSDQATGVSAPHPTEQAHRSVKVAAEESPVPAAVQVVEHEDATYGCLCFFSPKNRKKTPTHAPSPDNT